MPRTITPGGRWVGGSECTHLIARDHMAVIATRQRGVPVWRCSDCPTEDVWGPGWRYYGTVECKRCARAVVDRVECPQCATKTPQKEPA